MFKESEAIVEKEKDKLLDKNCQPQQKPTRQPGPVVGHYQDVQQEEQGPPGHVMIHSSAEQWHPETSKTHQ